MGHTVTQVEAQMASMSQGGMSAKKQGETRRGPLRCSWEESEQTLPMETAQSASKAKRNMESILPMLAGAIGGWRLCAVPLFGQGD